MPEFKFKSQIKVWRTKAKNKTYLRYIIEIPREIGELLDTNKKYIISISDE